MMILFMYLTFMWCHKLTELGEFCTVDCHVFPEPEVIALLSNQYSRLNVRKFISCQRVVDE